jgi:hypothetical protein
VSLPPDPLAIDVLDEALLGAPPAPPLPDGFVELGAVASPQPQNSSAAKANIFEDVFMRIPVSLWHIQTTVSPRRGAGPRIVDKKAPFGKQ